MHVPMHTVTILIVWKALQVEVGKSPLPVSQLKVGVCLQSSGTYKVFISVCKKDIFIGFEILKSTNCEKHSIHHVCAKSKSNININSSLWVSKNREQKHPPLIHPTVCPS